MVKICTLLIALGLEGKDTYAVGLEAIADGGIKKSNILVGAKARLASSIVRAPKRMHTYEASISAHAHTQTSPGRRSAAMFQKTRSQLRTWREAWNEDPNLFQGCSKIFLDVGSNRGTHVRKLFEPHKYTEAPYLKNFDEHFGPAEERTKPSSQTGICAFGFEANPKWAPTLNKLTEAYAAKGWRASWFAGQAVSDTFIGAAEFWDSDDEANSDWGFSEHLGPPAPKNQGGRSLEQVSVNSDEGAINNWWFSADVPAAEKKEVKVPHMDFPHFLQTLKTHAVAAHPKVSLMKMDIEGAEFVVLPPLWKKQLLCKDVIDTMTIEWHEPVFEAPAAAATIRENIQDAKKCKSGPSTQVLEVDDESYLNDGQPLP